MKWVLGSITFIQSFISSEMSKNLVKVVQLPIKFKNRNYKNWNDQPEGSYGTSNEAKTEL